MRVLASSLLSLCFSITTATNSAATNAAETAGWSERLHEDGIQILSRPVADSKYQEFRATIEVKGTTAHAVALLQDNAACTRWLFRCKESHVIAQLSNTERIFYQSMTLPFPARTRDAIFHAEISYNTDQSITITLASAPDQQAKTSYIRISHAYGYYLLQPINDESVRVTWQQFVDPAGVLPAWLVNTMLTDLPFKSLQSFRELIQEQPYRDAVFEYDASGIPSDILFTKP